MPIRIEKAPQIKKIEPGSDSIGAEGLWPEAEMRAPVQSRQAWLGVEPAVEQASCALHFGPQWVLSPVTS